MFKARVISFIGWALISVWSRTVRVRFENKTIHEKLSAEGKNGIYAFWHGRQFLLFHNYRHGGFVIPASESRDGEIQTGILHRFGFDVVRGSSKRKGDRALIGLVDSLRQGKSIAVAVDGPRGPRYEAKHGVAYMAGKLKKPIVPVVTSAKHYWILEKTWDNFLLPVPFTEGIIMYGDPIIVEGISQEELETKRRELDTALNRLMARADGYFIKQAHKAR